MQRNFSSLTETLLLPDTATVEEYALLRYFPVIYPGKCDVGVESIVRTAFEIFGESRWECA